MHPNYPLGESDRTSASSRTPGLLTRSAFTLSIASLLLSSLLSACSGFDEGAISLSKITRSLYPQPTSIPSGTKTITVNWNPNRETAVNSAGGGYRVYYDVNPTLSGSTPFVDVPYTSGSSAPTTAQIPNLGKARYYIHIIAYSALNPNGSAPASSTIDVP